MNALTDACPRCGGRIHRDHTYQGPHHAKLVCLACGRWVGWERTPMTAARAAAWTMPFGRHKGETLEQIAAADAPYLWWLIENIGDGSIQRAVGYYLDAPKETTP